MIPWGEEGFCLVLDPSNALNRILSLGETVIMKRVLHDVFFSTEDDNTSFSCLPVRGRISSVIPAAVNPTGQLLRLCYFCFAFVLSVRVSVSKRRPASSSLCSSADLEHGPQSQAQEFWDCRPVLPPPAGLLFIPWFTECGTLGRSLPRLPGFCEHVPLCLLHRNY